MKAIDLSGHTFGRLLVLGQKPNNKHNQRMWQCWCECGKTVAVSGNKLRKGNTRSCGCLRREVTKDSRWRHGLYEHRNDPPEAIAYHNAMKAARRYGVEFKFINLEEFINEVGHRPRSGYVLSRIDPELDYAPGNLHWRKRLHLTRWQERGYCTLLPTRMDLSSSSMASH